MPWWVDLENLSLGVTFEQGIPPEVSVRLLSRSSSPLPPRQGFSVLELPLRPGWPLCLLGAGTKSVATTIWFKTAFSQVESLSEVIVLLSRDVSSCSTQLLCHGTNIF